MRAPPHLLTQFRQKILDHSGPRKGVYAVEACGGSRSPGFPSLAITLCPFLSSFLSLGFWVQPHLKMKLWD